MIDQPRYRYMIDDMQTSAIRKELKRLTKQSTVHHKRCAECELFFCRNPYHNMIDVFQAELDSRAGETNSIAAKLIKLIISFWTK